MNTRYIAKSKTTNKTILPKNYSSPERLIKALKDANISISNVYFSTFQEMNFESADGKNTKRAKQFLSRKQKNHSTRRNLR